MAMFSFFLHREEVLMWDTVRSQFGKSIWKVPHAFRPETMIENWKSINWKSNQIDVGNKLMKSFQDYLQVGFNMQTSIKLLLPLIMMCFKHEKVGALSMNYVPVLCAWAMCLYMNVNVNMNMNMYVRYGGRYSNSSFGLTIHFCLF